MTYLMSYGLGEGPEARREEVPTKQGRLEKSQLSNETMNWACIGIYLIYTRPYSWIDFVHKHKNLINSFPSKEEHENIIILLDPNKNNSSNTYIVIFVSDR